MVTIITPYFNKEKTIQRCIESVLNQTYTDWEFIIVDDKSDRPLKDFFHIQDQRIKIFANDLNLGPGPTRQKGLNLARGEFVSFLDADDWWEDVFLEKSIEKINLNAAAVWSRTLLLGDSGSRLKRFNDIPHTSILKYLLKYGHPICTSSFMWNRKYLSTWCNLTTQQDSLFEFNNSIFCDRIIPTNLILVYQDKTGEEHREKYVKRSINYINKFKVYLHILEKGNLSLLQKTQILLWFIRLARKLRKIEDESYNEIVLEIHNNFNIKSYFVLRCVDFLLSKSFVNIHF